MKNLWRNLWIKIKLKPTALLCFFANLLEEFLFWVEFIKHIDPQMLLDACLLAGNTEKRSQCNAPYESSDLHSRKWEAKTLFSQWMLVTFTLSNYWKCLQSNSLISNVVELCLNKVTKEKEIASWRKSQGYFYSKMPFFVVEK